MPRQDETHPSSLADGCPSATDNSVSPKLTQVPLRQTSFMRGRQNSSRSFSNRNSDSLRSREALLETFSDNILPQLPTQKPNSSIAEWNQLRQKGLTLLFQFKKDLEMLVNVYTDELQSIVNTMNSCY